MKWDTLKINHFNCSKSLLSFNLILYCFSFRNYAFTTMPFLSNMTRIQIISRPVQDNVLTPTDVTKLQTAHFTDCAPYWYINSILQFPQFTCATWFAVTIQMRCSLSSNLIYPKKKKNMNTIDEVSNLHWYLMNNLSFHLKIINW